MKAGRYYFLIPFLLFFSCKPSPEKEMLNRLIQGKTCVLVFLSPSCPICQNYTRTLNILDSNYSYKGISFFGIFSGNNSSDSSGLMEFIGRYKPLLHVVRDPKSMLVKEIEARVTPEVFLINSEGIILYQGSIDNWLIEPGQKRSLITENYLEDALKSYCLGQPILIKRTQAKGCLIE